MIKKDKDIFDESRKESISLILQDLREQRGLTQQKVADALHLSYSTISHYEKGITIPPTEVIFRLASFYNVSTDYILNRCVSKIDYTKVIDTKLTDDLTIGNAVEIMTEMTKSEKEHFAFLLKLIKKSHD